MLVDMLIVIMGSPGHQPEKPTHDMLRGQTVDNATRLIAWQRNYSWSMVRSAATADGPGGFMHAENTWNMVLPLGKTSF